MSYLRSPDGHVYVDLRAVEAVEVTENDGRDHLYPWRVSTLVGGQWFTIYRRATENEAMDEAKDLAGQCEAAVEHLAEVD